MLKVIAGSLKGRKINTLAGKSTRPTANRVREALFNILAPWIAGCMFLDGFAGSGAIGIEALSRGADLAVFVEDNPQAVRMIRRNIQDLGLDKRAFVLAQSLPEALPVLAKQGYEFDFAFLDPPYSQDLLEPCLNQLYAHNLLKPEGQFILETATKEDIPQLNIPLIGEINQKTYGDTKLLMGKFGLNGVQRGE